MSASVTQGDIPDNVRRFLHDRIDSVVQLEILLLLFGAAGPEVTAAEVGRELRIDPTWAQGQLAELCARGVLTCTDAPAARYRYEARGGDVDAAVAALATAYADRRVSVIALIYSKPTDQIRSFADAFRLRKEKDDG